MDRIGYKAYLQSLGNQNHYIGQIKALIDLEKELHIDLDDYIPYNGDYSKPAALTAMLPDWQKYNEKLNFSINSYMRYRLSGFENNKADSNEPTCSMYFTFNGKETDFKSTLSEFMSEQEAQLFVRYIKEYGQSLDKDEYIEETRTISRPHSNPQMLSCLIESVNYNVNIKALTLMMISLLLDIKLTLGFVGAALTIIGFNGRAIAKINVTEGEKCLIMEAMHSRNRVINENVFSVCNNECVHNDLPCKYQNEDMCTIKKSDIIAILNGLCEKNIFKKHGNFYKYSF
mgnify:CR=1 FL=1